MPAWCRTFFLAASAGEATTTNPSAETIKATDKVFMLLSRSLERVNGARKRRSPEGCNTTDRRKIPTKNPCQNPGNPTPPFWHNFSFLGLLAPCARFGASSPPNPEPAEDGHDQEA